MRTLRTVSTVLTALAALTASLLATSTPQTDDGLRVRYSNPTARMSLTVKHDITVVRDEPIHADRNFSYDLSLTGDASAMTVTIDQAKGDFTAHEMTQRLPTRTLTGKSFSLPVGNDGRELRPAEAPLDVAISLGPVVDPGFSVATLIAETLPVLPARKIHVGATWSTERPIRSLEGWAWTAGTLTSNHRITKVDHEKGHAVITAETEATARLGAVDEAKQVSGDLERTLRWTFDATDGRLLSLSMTQQTEGNSVVPQGEIVIRQITTVELAPRS